MISTRLSLPVTSMWTWVTDWTGLCVCNVLVSVCLNSGVAVAVFKHHTGPITSVEWHPTDSSVFVASGSDNQVTLWDLAVERDNETEGKERHMDVPPQLLFIHMVCQFNLLLKRFLFILGPSRSWNGLNFVHVKRSLRLCCAVLRSCTNIRSSLRNCENWKIL